MENKEVKNTTTVEPLNDETLVKMLEAFSERSDLPRGTVDEIFNLGVKVERQRQNMLNGTKIMKDMRREQKKAERKARPSLTQKVMAKLGYVPAPKEETKKTEEKK